MKQYIFTSERLGLRNWQINDLNEFAKLNADPLVMEHFPSTLSREETAQFIDRLINHFDKWGYNYFAVEDLRFGELLGFIGLARQEYEAPFTPCTDIGWRLKQSAWGKGFATEGAQRCLLYAKENLGLNTIYSVCTSTNKPSEKVMQKIGMAFQGEFKHSRLKDYPRLETCYYYKIEL